MRTAWRDATTSLRLRVLLLTLAAFVAVGIPALLSFLWIVNGTVEKLGTRFAEKQVLYDQYRGLEALRREIALAETIARSPSLIAWAKDEASPEKKERALAELEHYRLAFRDNSYFFVIAGSGNYYFNDAADAFAGNQLRYTLSKDNPRDAWFYKTITMGAGCPLNVDNDRALGLTKVWMNCLVYDGGRTLGIVGTGIDLTAFIRNVVNTGQDGIESLFVDGRGAIQAARDQSQIDFRSLTKSSQDIRTVFQLIDGETGRAGLQAMLSAAQLNPTTVQTGFFDIGGKSMLVGVGYLTGLGWFSVTIMDVGRIIDWNLFLPIAILLAFMMIAAAALVTWMFKRSVLDRLSLAEQTVARLETGDYVDMPADPRRDEISRLTNAIGSMAATIRDNTAGLEETVRARTEQLRSIAFLDPLTSVMNRRGFAEAFARQRHKPGRTGPMGLLLIDVDRFKLINDVRGHAVGDDVIVEVSRRLTVLLREGDICARWGGDEFVVLVGECTQPILEDIGHRLLTALRSVAIPLPTGSVRITASIGACLVGEHEDLAAAAVRADQALYAAKNAGRNRLTLHGEASDAGTASPRVA